MLKLLTAKFLLSKLLIFKLFSYKIWLSALPYIKLVLFKANLLLVISCGDPLTDYYNDIKEHGYIPYTTPLKYAGTGSMVGGKPDSLSLVAHPDTCFPSNFAAEHGALRRKDHTQLPKRSKTVVIDTDLHASFLESFQVGNLSIVAGTKFEQVKHMEITYEGIHVVYMDHIALTKYYRSHMDSVCKEYLEKVGFIIQAIAVDKMVFKFFDESKNNIYLDLNNIEEILDLSVDISWDIVNEVSLVINSTKFIGYQLGALRHVDDGLVLFRSSKVRNNKYIFEDVSSLGSIDDDRDPVSSLNDTSSKLKFYYDLEEIESGGLSFTL